MAKRRRTRGIRGAGTIIQLPGGQWRLRVSMGGCQVDYGFYATEELAGDAQARWRLTHLPPEDDPQQVVELPASVAVAGIRCDEWFARWQDAKKARRSRVRVDNKRGGADSAAARDRAYWSKWWSPAIGAQPCGYPARHHGCDRVRPAPTTTMSRRLNWHMGSSPETILPSVRILRLCSADRS